MVRSQQAKTNELNKNPEQDSSSTDQLDYSFHPCVCVCACVCVCVCVCVCACVWCVCVCVYLHSSESAFPTRS